VSVWSPRLEGGQGAEWGDGAPRAAA